MGCAIGRDAAFRGGLEELCDEALECAELVHVCDVLRERVVEEARVRLELRVLARREREHAHALHQSARHEPQQRAARGGARQKNGKEGKRTQAPTRSLFTGGPPVRVFCPLEREIETMRENLPFSVSKSWSKSSLEKNLKENLKTRESEEKKGICSRVVFELCEARAALHGDGRARPVAVLSVAYAAVLGEEPLHVQFDAACRCGSLRESGPAERLCVLESRRRKGVCRRAARRAPVVWNKRGL